MLSTSKPALPLLPDIRTVHKGYTQANQANPTCGNPVTLAASLEAANSSAKTQSTPVDNAAAAHRPMTVSLCPAEVAPAPESSASLPLLLLLLLTAGPPLADDRKDGASSSIKAATSSSWCAFRTWRGEPRKLACDAAVLVDIVVVHHESKERQQNDNRPSSGFRIPWCAGVQFQFRGILSI